MLSSNSAASQLHLSFPFLQSFFKAQLHLPLPGEEPPQYLMFRFVRPTHQPKLGIFGLFEPEENKSSFCVIERKDIYLSKKLMKHAQLIIYSDDITIIVTHSNIQK